MYAKVILQIMFYALSNIAFTGVSKTYWDGIIQINTVYLFYLGKDTNENKAYWDGIRRKNTIYLFYLGKDTHKNQP